jgi:hypothetical protein
MDKRNDSLFPLGRSAADRGRASGLEISAAGVIAGAIGAGTIALYFLVVDSVLREPLYSPAVLGGAIFDGVVAPAGSPVDLGRVVAWTWVHGLLFMTFGLLAARLLASSRFEPKTPAFALMLAIGLQLGFLAATGMLGAEVAAAIGHGWVLMGNVVAATSMALTFDALRVPSAAGQVEVTEH